MLHLLHVGDEVSGGDEVGRSIATGDDDFRVRVAVIDGIDEFGGGKETEVNGDGSFVKDHEPIAAVVEYAPNLLEPLGGTTDVVRCGFALDEALRAVAVGGDGGDAAVDVGDFAVSLAFDELCDVNTSTGSDCAEGQSNGSGGLTLAVAGVEMYVTHSGLILVG